MEICVKKISYLLNEVNFTAKVIVSPKASGKISIPHCIIYQNQEFIVDSVGESSFKKNFKIKSVEIPIDSEIQSIDKEAFAQSSIERISIPSSIKKIGEFAFFSCKYLSTIEISNNSQLNLIERYAFTETIIDSICIPSHVNSIGEFAFFGCKKLQHVEFSKTSELRSIQKNAFAQSSIKNIVIPSQVREICDFSFYQCKNLQSVDFSGDSDLHSIGKDAFSLSSIESLLIPSKVDQLDEGWCSWTTKLNQITIMKNNKKFSYVNNSFIIQKSDEKSNDFDFLIFSRRDIEKVEIPSYVKKIGMYALCNCENIKHVNFLDDSKLNLIEKCAFSKSSIVYITIPSQVQIIGELAFSGCWCLEVVEILSDEILIDDYCFSYNQKLAIVSFPNAQKIKFGKNIFNAVSTNFMLFVCCGSILNNLN